MSGRRRSFQGYPKTTKPEDGEKPTEGSPWKSRLSPHKSGQKFLALIMQVTSRCNTAVSRGLLKAPNWKLENRALKIVTRAEI
jgi:hypothetical protein